MARTELDVRQEQAEARRILVGQAVLFAEVGVAVTAMGAWGVQFQVGHNLVVDQGDVAFARMVTRLVRGEERREVVRARLAELTLDEYGLVAQVPSEVEAAAAAPGEKYGEKKARKPSQKERARKKKRIAQVAEAVEAARDALATVETAQVQETGAERARVNVVAEAKTARAEVVDADQVALLVARTG